MPPLRFLPAAILFFLLALPAASPGAASKGDPAPPLLLKTIAGESVSLEKYRGDVVLLDFFASWCDPCREAVPSLAALHRKYQRKGLRILGVALNDRESGVRIYQRDFAIPYPLALGSDAVSDDFGVSSLPTLILVSRRGVVAERFRGFSGSGDARLEERIRQLLAEPAPKGR